MIERDLPGARVLFSTRRGGLSRGPFRSLNLGANTGDAGELVSENRRRLAAHGELACERIAHGCQVHGVDLREWSSAPETPFDEVGTGGEGPPPVDGHLTAERELGLLVLVADCYPVALAGADAVAMLHCGWRGLAEGIIAAAAARLGDVRGAVVGPGIGACCYAVGKEVARRFESFPEALDGGRLDLRAVADAQLRVVGVEAIDHVELCTSCNPDLFFSHRRDRGVTGRQAGLVWRRAE